MKKFLILYHASNTARDLMASEQIPQTKARFEAWAAWAENNKEMIINFGMPLSVGKLLTEDAIKEGQGTISEYSIVQGESLEEVSTKLKNHPHFTTPGGATIEVLEFLPTPGII